MSEPIDYRELAFAMKQLAEKEGGERMEAQAQLAEARAVLKLIQFSGSAHACPYCAEFPDDERNHSYFWGSDEPTGLIPGHAPDCRLKKALGDG